MVLQGFRGRQSAHRHLIQTLDCHPFQVPEKPKCRATNKERPAIKGGDSLNCPLSFVASTLHLASISKLAFPKRCLHKQTLSALRLRSTSNPSRRISIVDQCQPCLCPSRACQTKQAIAAIGNVVAFYSTNRHAHTALLSHSGVDFSL